MDAILRHFQTNVEESRGLVTISNINTRRLIMDIEKAWGTKVITNNIFKATYRTSLTFYSFFVPDIYCTLSEMVNMRGIRFLTPRPSLKLILNEIETNTWYRDYFQPPVKSFDYSVLSQMKYTLLPLQMRAMEVYETKVVPLHLRGYLLAADVGTGKSIMAIALSLLVKADITVIVCPLSIMSTVWVDALNVQFDGKKRVWRSDKNIPIDNTYDYYLFHHEALDKAVEFFKQYRFKNPCIVSDECHYLNDMKSARTQRYLEMCDLSKSNNIIHSSGTAIKALASEAIPLFKAIDPYFTPMVEETFKNVFARSALRTLKIMNHRLGLVSHKISKDAVMDGIPKPITIELKVKLPNGTKYTIDAIRGELDKFIADRTKFYLASMPEHTRIYKGAVDKYVASIPPADSEAKISFRTYAEYIETMRRGYDAYSMGPLSNYCNVFEKERVMPLLSPVEKKEFANSKSVYKYVNLKIMGEFLGGVLGRRRAQLHSDLIQYSGLDKIVLEAEKKTICFTDYVDTAIAAKNYFEEKGFNPILVYSDTNKDIVGILNRFKTGDTENPLIATIKSFSVGTTATNANVVIFLNQPFRAYEHEQAAARVYRLGQTAQVYIYNVVLDTGELGNLSTRMQEIQNWSREQTDAMLGSDLNKIGLEEALNYMFISEDYLATIEDLNYTQPSALNWR